MRYDVAQFQSFLSIYTTFARSVKPRSSVILILDASSALAIPEAATGSRTPLATEVAAAGARLGLVFAAAYAEEDGGDEEAGEGCPCEGVGVGA